jgi:hypothetical protein
MIDQREEKVIGNWQEEYDSECEPGWTADGGHLLRDTLTWFHQGILGVKLH